MIFEITASCNTIWETTPNENKLSISNEHRLHPSEKRLDIIFLSHGLEQVNKIPNGRGIFLDLIRYTDVDIINLIRVPLSFQIDFDGSHHRYITYSMPFSTEIIQAPDETPKFNYATTKHNNAKLQLSEQKNPFRKR